MLGHFLIVKCLGEGGMSRVYEAIDTRLDRKVAIKIPKAEVLANPEACDWFTQEGQSIARMKDPHVVRVYHSEEFDGLPCHVMEFIPGETLARRIQRDPKLAPETAVAIARDVALGLLEIHVHGRIHGDIKPANIMVGLRHATIVDFGLSRPLSSGGRDGRAAAGTPAYMAPERVRGESSGVSEDIYSLGCTLLETLSGKRVEMTDDGQPVLPQVAELAGVSADLLDIVQSLIAEDPIDRPASAKESAQLLEGWLSRRKRVRRNRWLAAVAAPLLLAAGAFGWTLYPRGQIAICTPGGSVRRLCVSLADAVSAVQEGETLELRSEGPFLCDSAIVSPKPLSIRAAAQVVPRVELDGSTDRPGGLRCTGPLALEGILVRCRSDWNPQDDAMVCCEGDSLRIVNCRFELPEHAEGMTCLTAVGTATVDVKNSVFVGRGGTAIGWEPPDKAQMTVLNCLTLGTTAVEYRAASAPDPHRHLCLERCTLIGSHVLSVVPPPQSRLASDPGRPVSVEARANVFRTGVSLVQFRDWPPDRVAAKTMAAQVDWRDQSNLHASDLDRTVIWKAAQLPLRALRTDALGAWTPHWEMTIEDVDAVFVLGGNVESFCGHTPHARVAQRWLQQAAIAGKVLCAVGDGPAVLSAAGLLKGRQATVQPRFVATLEAEGVEVSSEGLVQDGSILTAESNVHLPALVSRLTDKPVVLALIAENDFWFDDFRAAKYEVERAGGNFLTISTTADPAIPNKANGGEPILPDLVLPLLRHDGGWNPGTAANTWLSSDLSELDPITVPMERFALGSRLTADAGSVPGFQAAVVGPGRMPRP